MMETAALMLDHYQWQAALLSLLGIIVLTKAGKFFVFKVPALAQSRSDNREQDKLKLAKSKYAPIVKDNQRVGLYCNLVFFLILLPFCSTLTWPQWWQVPVNVLLILLVYDFFYYLMHRFLFHGQGRFRQVHALHHQARKPTYIDAHYVHPTETVMGLSLFFATIVGLALLQGPFHVLTIVLVYVAYVQLNQINHTYIQLPYFPFRHLTQITVDHHTHHENMHKGNYASITMLYDRLFGTYEKPGTPR